MRMKSLYFSFCILTLLCLTMVLCNGCCLLALSGRGDYQTEPLVEDYVILRISAENIILAKGSEPWEIVIESKITHVAWNQAFLCVQQIEPNRKPTVGGLPVTYYIVSVHENTTYGPMTKQEFESQCNALEIGDLCSWIKVEDLPRVTKD